MFHARSRTTAALAAGVLLLAPLAGCGGDDGKDGDKLPAASTSKAAEPTKADIAEAQDFIAGLVDAIKGKRTADIQVDLGSSLSASGQVDYAGSGTELSLNMDAGAQKIRVVIAGGVLYLQQKEGGKFTKVDKDDPNLGALFGQFENIGPQAALTSVKAGIEKVEKVGTEKVDGEDLTRYKLTVDTAKAASSFGAEAGTAGEGKTVFYDLFVDGDGLLRQVKLEISGQKVTMRLSNWGKPVDIAVPPASQVTVPPKS